MDGWLDMDTSCTRFVDLLYSFLDYFHSDAGTLGVLFDVLKAQPPTAKTRFQQLLDELTNKSPMMDLIYEEMNNLPHVKTLLDCLLMYCSNMTYLVTSICLQAKISDTQFEEELYHELWSFMEKYQVINRGYLNLKHDDYIKKWSISCKTPFQRITLMKNAVGKEIDDILQANELPTEQAKEIKDFIQLQQEEKQQVIGQELSKLTFMEKPIIFNKGKPIVMKAEDLICKIHKMLYIDEQKIQWLMNIHTVESFLDQTLMQLRKAIQFRYKWKDKELWFEWLKNQYRKETVQTVLPQKVVPMKIIPEPGNKKASKIILVKDIEAAMEKEINDKNEWIHCNTLNWIKSKNNQEIQLESQKEIHNQWKQEGNDTENEEGNVNQKSPKFPF